MEEEFRKEVTGGRGATGLFPKFVHYMLQPLNCPTYQS